MGGPLPRGIVRPASMLKERRESASRRMRSFALRSDAPGGDGTSVIDAGDMVGEKSARQLPVRGYPRSDCSGIMHLTQ